MSAARVALLALVALGLLAGAFFACFERVEEDVAQPASRLARENPYLAAGRLLEAMGHEVEFLDGVAALTREPPEGAAFFWPTRRDGLSERRAAALLAWAGRGGQLVVVTWTLWEQENRRPDLLLDPLDLRQYMLEDELAENEDELEQAEPGAPDAEDLPLDLELPDLLEMDPERYPIDETEVRAPGAGAPLRVAFDRRWYWEGAEAKPGWRAVGETGAHLVHVELGFGGVTALTDDYFLRNPHVGELDHAELVVRLARAAGPRAPVWIVTDDRWPGLAALAWLHGWPVAIALGGLLVAWVWRASVREGPVLPAPDPARRRFLEHVEAVGRYHWRHGRGQMLLGAARQAVHDKLRDRHPAWARLPARERALRLAELVELEPAQVRGAFEDDAPEAFVTSITTLERIRAAL